LDQALAALECLRNVLAGGPALRKDGTTWNLEPAIRKLQLAGAEAILKIASPVPGGDKQRALTRVGSPM
jgi:hypothetical protein